VPGRGCHDSRLVAGLKSELSQHEFNSTHSWAIDFSLPDLVSIVIQRLKREADAVSGADVRRVVLGHPVAFVGAEGPDFASRQAAAEERLRDAALAAGFEEIVLLEEPAAAVLEEDLEDGVAVAVDFGGGTFDVAVIEFRDGGGEVTGLAGAAIGGDRFDEALFKAKVGPALGVDTVFTTRTGDQRSLPNWFVNRLSTLSGVKHLLSDPLTARLLREYKAYGNGDRLRSIEAMLYGGHAYAFYSAIERAKIELSERETSTIEFHRPDIDLSVPVLRTEFEGLIARDMKVVAERIEDGLDQAGVKPGDVDVVLRTGGSSSIPAFTRVLDEYFDPEIVKERPVFTTVVHGLAAFAREQWS
jgi:hypothetical chaperone protein